MNIVITGGAGFIGSHLSEKLLSLGHRIIVIDNFHDFYSYEIKIKNILETTGKIIKNLPAEKDEAIKVLCNMTENKNYKLYYCDIRDKEKIDEIFSAENPEVVINLAGLAGVRPSISEPLLYEDVNIKGYMNILETCVKYNVKKFIQASSSSVYGNNKKIPFSEDDIVDFPISPYAATKKSCETIGHVYHSLYKIDMFQLRFFTVYGERQRSDLAIHKFTELISHGKKISIYGDGNSTRDYTYVGDITEGIVKSMEYLLKNEDVYEILNLGNSNAVSLNEMIETIENELNIKAEKKYFPMQAGDVLKTYADIRKAEKLIGYKPSVNFCEGIRRFVKWYKKGEI